MCKEKSNNKAVTGAIVTSDVNTLETLITAIWMIVLAAGYISSSENSYSSSRSSNSSTGSIGHKKAKPGKPKEVAIQKMVEGKNTGVRNEWYN